MKIITTILLTMACFSAAADTNSTDIIAQGMLKIAEVYYKMGVLKGESDTLHYLSTNHLQNIQGLPTKETPIRAWNEFLKANPQLENPSLEAPTSSPKSPRQITNAAPSPAITNDGTRWLESPMTVPIYNYHTNGWGTESLWGTYKNTDPTIQIGLRLDGLVVWKKRTEEK